MTLPVVHLPEAMDDIIDAHVYYEQQSAGLGDRFAEALEDLVARIRANPQIYAVHRRGVRAAPLRRFPYVVYYRERDRAATPSWLGEPRLCSRSIALSAACVRRHGSVLLLAPVRAHLLHRPRPAREDLRLLLFRCGLGLSGHVP